jgi:hypothetical protein
MGISGNLKTMHLGDLLQWCGMNLKTGTLRLRRGPLEKRLFFDKGRLFSSTSNSPRETLGQFLIRSGILSEEQLFKALFQQDRTQQPLGQILIGQKLLSEEELQDLLRLKTEETIYDCFLWSEGDFSFEDDVLPDKIPVSLPLDLTGVILEGARRSDEWARIKEAFPSRLSTFSVDGEAPADDLDEEDRRILELVERKKNLAEIALEMHAVEFYVASRLLELHNKGRVRVERVVEEVPVEKQVEALHERLREGVVCYNAAQYPESLAAFQAALAIDSQNKYARIFVLKIERLLKDREAVADLPLNAIPTLKIPLSALGNIELDPQEGFVLSRINGEWDVASILKICPLGEEETLLIFKRFRDDGLIELKSA